MLLRTTCRGWGPATFWSHRGPSSVRPALRVQHQYRALAAKAQAGKVEKAEAMEASSSAAVGEDPEQAQFLQHQKAAPRITLAEEARLLVDAGGFGVLSTLSSKSSEEGFPVGSVVEYAADEQGRPVFSLSALSPHTSDVQKDPRVSLTVLAQGFKDMDAARVNLRGVLSPISSPEEREAVRHLYLQRHPGSFWVDFGDFTWFRMDEVVGARLVGGFGRAGKVTAEEYLSAQLDPVAKFSGPVCGHMNEDHADSSVAMVKHYAGLTVAKASMVSLDRLGINMVVQKEENGAPFKLRLPFPRPATDRKSIKELIVEMTRAAAAATAGGA